MRHRRPRPIDAVSHGPVVGNGTIQQFDEPGGNLPAAVPALVDDERIFACLPVKLPNEIVLTVNSRVRHIDVAYFAVRFLRDIGSVLLNPGPIPQSGFSCAECHRHIDRR